MPYSIRLPDGVLVQDIPDEMTPEIAKARILKAYPQYAPTPSTDRTWGEAAKDIGAGVRAESAAQINQEVAKGDAAMATAIGVLVVGAFLWLTLKRIWHKSRATPHQNGIFIGSTLAALAIGKATGQITTALLFQPVHSGEAIGMASVLGNDRTLYEAAEDAAKTEKRGLWHDADPVAPWEFRHTKRSR